MVWFGIASLFVAVAALALAAYVVVRAHNDATRLRISQDEIIAKNSATFMATANALSEKVDYRVAKRVQLVNAALRGDGTPQENQAAAAAVGEAPVTVTSIMNEAHEIERELRRPKRESADYQAREPGVGSTIPDAPVEL